MTPMHQPTKTSQVFHQITLDGNDVELTRFVEWFEEKWLTDKLSAYNISNVLWDNGHDTLRFETNCENVDLSVHVLYMSAQFPQMFMMYDYYTGEDTEDYVEHVAWFYDGKAQQQPK